VSLVVVVLERLMPRARQSILRRGITTDLFYMVFNGHFLGVYLARLSTPVAARFDAELAEFGLYDGLYRAQLAGLPAWQQFILALLAIDLLQWCIHNMLHRVPALWEVHKVHHSIETMDFMGSMRFHWGEVIVYKSLGYPIAALLGASGEVLFALAVFNTATGHFNHSNLRVGIGPLKYLFNNPAMHVWHHEHTGRQPMVNFGITLSIWDYLFRTAHVASAPPTRLGFDKIERFPSSAIGQLLHPLPIERLLTGRASS